MAVSSLGQPFSFVAFYIESLPRSLSEILGAPWVKI